MLEPPRGNKARYAALALIITLAGGAASAVEREAFRVCADPNNLPFSNKDEEGFENRLAELLAAELGLDLEYTWFPQRRGFIRNTLRAADPQRDGYKCDVVMGVPDGFELVITTEPYYRSTYALVYGKGRDLDDVITADDFINLDEARKQKLRIGVFTPTPATDWLAVHGMGAQMVAYPAMSGDPNAYPGQILEQELAEKKLDAVIVWGPIAGYFAKQSKDLELVVIPLQSEPGIKFDFAISAGVRFGEGDAKREIEGLMQKVAPKIEAVLKEYNVPLVKGGGAPL